MQTIFVTGTDTGVGKTLFSKALIEYYVSCGLKVTAMKPVAAGAVKTDVGLRNDDAEILLAAMNTNFTYSQINPYVFEEPIAPHIAAKNNNVSIDVNELDNAVELLSSGSDQLIVEGAGGWQVPLNDELTLADWVSKKQWPVILVVGIRLGCINHSLLSYFDILQKKNPLLGWVANIVDPELTHVDEIVTYLDNKITAPRLGTIPFLRQIEQENIQSNLQSYLDFSLLK